jgi:hypothetical protein
VLAALHSDPVGPLAGQLATPWRLTLALAAFRAGGDPAELLPAAPNSAGVTAQEYAQFVDTQLLSRYLPAAVYLHDPTGRYTTQNVHRWMTALASGLAWQARHDKSATDIQLDQWWEPTGRRMTRLTHGVLIALPGLPWLILSIVTGNPWMAAGAGSIVIIAVVGATGSPSPHQLRIRELSTSHARRRLASQLMLGLAGGLTVGVIAGLQFGLAYGLEVGLVVGLGTGLAHGITAGAMDSSPQATGPRDVIRADGRYGLALGLGLVLVLGLGFEVASRRAAGATLLFAAALGLSFGLPAGVGTTGASAWTRYYISVVINAACKRSPLRFGAFLDWARQAGLLRVSGVTYQFRHRQLQDWLTSHPTMATASDPRQDDV